jgi:hypothetical protein
MKQNDALSCDILQLKNQFGNAACNEFRVLKPGPVIDPPQDPYH